MKAPRRRAVLALLVLAAAGCAVGPPPQVITQAAPKVAPRDASYDWHVLMILPFGAVLKDSPTPLHEVLQFDDSARPGAAAENKDCYTTDAPPRFIERRPGQFLLCFDHDRLQRIEASVQLAPNDAPRVVADACATWLHSDATAPARNSCEGVEGTVRYSAQLQPSSDGAATLIVTLSTAPPEPTAEVAPDVAH